MYVEDKKLNDEAKARLKDATLLEYNIAKFIADIKADSGKSNAQIWVTVLFFTFRCGLKLKKRV